MFVNSSLHLLRTGVCLAVFAIFLFTPNIASAIPAAPFPFNEFQPDGAEISLYARGDEHFNWMEDPDGYTVVRNKGWFEYAERGPSGHLNPNGMIVGRDNPRAVGLQKHILPSPAIRAQSAKVSGAGGSGSGASAPQAVGPSGTVKNLVVMIRFSDHVGRTLPSVADMDILFNAVGGHATLAPTGSVRDVYFENSYGQMTLDSVVNPGIGDWITVSNTEAYYANGNSGDSTLWQALREALDVLDAQIDFQDYDTDNDGYIDSIAFIHSGYAAEWGGTDAYGTHYSNRIWSHRWYIQPQWNSNDGVSVYPYHISPGVWGTSGSNIGRIGVIAHETGHFFGLPDLYDTDSGAGDGIGSWGMMANSWGFDGSQRCPPHFSPWSKINLGWYSPTVIDQPGQYTINQTETNPEVYRINSGFPSGEYLLIENRQDTGFDCAIPQGGVAIWHIDDTTGYNTQGYPGQGGWPGNGNHYRVALLQADGNYNLEKGNNRGDSGDMHHAAGVDAIGPGPGNHPNTDTYQDGIINVTGITISDVSASGPSMTFCLNGCTGLTAPSGLSATSQSTSQISLSWSDNSDGEDGFTIERSFSGSNWSFLASTGADTSSYNDGGLSPDSTWFYRVRAFVAGETSSWSNTASATTDNVPPVAPGSMRADAVSASQINLSWVDQAGNEDGYRLERSDNGGASFDTVFNLGANVISFSDTGLAASTVYDYRLVAHNSGGDSDPEQMASARTFDPPPFVDYVAQGQSNSEGSVSGGFSNTHFDDETVLQSITEQQIGGNARKARSSLSHRWTFSVSPGTTGMILYANAWSSGSSDGDSFQFQWSTDGSSFSNAFLVSTTNTGIQQSASLPSNLSGTVYVRVVDTDDSRGTVALDTVFVDHLFIRADNMPVTAPADPSDLAAVVVAYNQVNLIWTDNADDETGYELERSEGGGSYSLIATLGEDVVAYTDNDINPDTLYQYRVRAMKGTTGSGYDTSNSFTTPGLPLGSINLSANGFKVKGKHQVDLTWSGASGDFVDIHWNGDPSVFETRNDDFHDHNIGAKGGATYTYKVCNAGTSTCSNIVTVNF
jgi:M6 family metalloprotease-like protein